MSTELSPFPPANTPISRGEAKNCSTCNRLKRIDEFPLENRRVSARCRACHRLVAAQKTKRQRDLELSRRIGQIKGTESYPKLSELCTELIRKFGGMEKFVDEWHGQLKQAIEDRPGSALVLNSFLSMAKLVSALSSQTGADRNLDDYDDEDLENLMELQVSEWIERNPKYLLAVADTLGYRVIPSDVIDEPGADERD